MPKGCHDHSTWKRHGFVGACEKFPDVVKKMAEAGATLDAIGAAIGTQKGYVRRFLEKHDIKRPDWRMPPNDHPMSRATSGALNASWKGGRRIEKRKNREFGYVKLWMPGHPEADRHNSVYEHRIVMAKMIGRPLKREEVVHHKNDNGEDNRPENLQLFPNNGEHLRVTLTGVPCPARGRKSRSNPKKSKTNDPV
jgi:hypothetical protein